MTPLSVDEIAYVAGLFEGEGCISIFKRKDSERTEVAIHLEMTDEDVVRHYHTLIGVGNLSKRSRRGRRKPTYIVSIYKKQDVKDFLIIMKSWWGSRRTAKAEEALSYL